MLCQDGNCYMYIMPITNLALLPLSIVGGVQAKDLRVHLSFFFHQTQTWSVGMQASSLVSLSPFVSAYILLLDPLFIFLPSVFIL